MKHQKSSSRVFLAHLGSYAIVMATLLGINLITSTGEWWFLYPALAWGAVVSIHLLYKLPLDKLKTKWRRFFRHIGLYIIVIGMLAGINLVASPGEWWFLYPSLVWGAILGFHFLFGILLAGGDKAKTARELTAAEQRQARLSSTDYVSRGRRLSLSNKALQFHLSKALTYKARIDRLVETTPGPSSREHLQNLAFQLDDWMVAIVDLAQRIDTIQRDNLLRRDLETVPKSIRTLEKRLTQETNPLNRAELERTLLNLNKQLASLEQLNGVVKRAEIQLESMLSAIGTIYSQILTGQSVSHVADYSRLSSEVDERVRRLQDQLEALAEVKLGQV